MANTPNINHNPPNTTNMDDRKQEEYNKQNQNNIDIDDNTVIITKVILDFDDALFPSFMYKQHDILKYHESTSTEPVHVGRDKFKNQYEPNFMSLKKDIDLVIFKLMQLYDRENLYILSSGDYDWIKSTLSYYEYLLNAYNIEILSTQQYVKDHPNQKDFDLHNSLKSKQFLMKQLLNRWKQQIAESDQYKNKNVKIRVISIGDSLFEYLACYNIGFDYVNRIKLIEDPTVEQMKKLWEKILYLTTNDIYDQNVIFTTDSEFYYLDNERMAILEQHCLDRINHKENIVWPSLYDVITNGNDECYEIVKNVENGKQYKHKKQPKLQQSVVTDTTSTHHKSNDDHIYHPPKTTMNDLIYQIQQIQLMNQQQIVMNHINYINQTNHINNNNQYNIQQNSQYIMSAIPSIESQILYSQQQLLYAQQLVHQPQFLASPPYSTYSETPSFSLPLNHSMTNSVMASNVNYWH